MEAQFVIVKKIVAEKKRNSDGQTVRNPIDNNKPVTEGEKTVLETIRIDEIRAIRGWKKSKFELENGSIKGDKTVIYMKGKDNDKSSPEIHIEENHLDFSLRIGAVPLPE